MQRAASQQPGTFDRWKTAAPLLAVALTLAILAGSSVRDGGALSQRVTDDEVVTGQRFAGQEKRAEKIEARQDIEDERGRRVAHQVDYLVGRFDAVYGPGPSGRKAQP